MSLIKLLIASFGDEENDVTASALNLFDIELESVEWDRLMAMTAYDFDVVLFEDNPAHDNLGLINRLRTIAAACKVIVVIRQSSAQAVSYLQAGATGLLDSIHESSQLAEIIRQVYQGEYYLDQQIAQLLAMRQVKKTLEPFAVLSSREFDILCLLAEGCSLQNIADQLGISSKTVSNCQALIKLKLGINTKQQLKQVAKTHGLMIDKSL